VPRRGTSGTRPLYKSARVSPTHPLRATAPQSVEQAELELAIKFVKEADYLIISAGAGLSASVGLDYTSEAVFADLYPTMHALGFRCMYQFIGKLPISEELKWGYLLTHAHRARFTWGSTKLYEQLRQLAQAKGADRYFVKTSNADGFFAQSGFDVSRVFTPQGDYSNMQCLKHCSKSSSGVFPTRPFVDAALPHIDTAQTMEITEPAVMPRCPLCGGAVFFNVRGGDWFIESPYAEVGSAYQHFVEQAITKSCTPDPATAAPKKGTVVILEIGAGFNTPGVLRWPNERLLAQHECVRLVRINKEYPHVPRTSGSIRAVGLPLDAATVVPLFLKEDSVDV
jgi:NAD-dependent SIR2 family protein deacetylase